MRFWGINKHPNFHIYDISRTVITMNNFYKSSTARTAETTLRTHSIYRTLLRANRKPQQRLLHQYLTIRHYEVKSKVQESREFRHCASHLRKA